MKIKKVRGQTNEGDLPQKSNFSFCAKFLSRHHIVSQIYSLQQISVQLSKAELVIGEIRNANGKLQIQILNADFEICENSFDNIIPFINNGNESEKLC